MTKTISAAEANRQFSRILREIGEGRSYVVTSHGRPIARILPFAESGEQHVNAKNRLMARLRSQRAIDVGRWKREELYEDAG